MQLQVTEVSFCIYFPGLPVKQPTKGKPILRFLVFLLGGGRKDNVLLRAAQHCTLTCLLHWTALQATLQSPPVPRGSTDGVWRFDEFPKIY